MEPKKENVFIEYLTHPAKWFNALIGRPKPIAIPQNQVTYQEQKKDTAVQSNELNTKPVQSQATEKSSTDDPLTKDFEFVGGFFKKVIAIVIEATRLVFNKSKAVSKEVTDTGSRLGQVDTGTAVFQAKFKKIVPLILFLAVLVLILGAGFYVIQKFINRKESPVIVSGPTPTAVEYIPSIPSLYATDETVLNLEQEISVLDREIAGVQLRETTLNPPILDFNINFQ